MILGLEVYYCERVRLASVFTWISRPIVICANLRANPNYHAVEVNRLWSGVYERSRTWSHAFLLLLASWQVCRICLPASLARDFYYNTVPNIPKRWQSTLILLLPNQLAYLGRDGNTPDPTVRLTLTTRNRKYLDNFLTRTGPFTDEDAFEPGQPAIEGLDRQKVL